MEGDRGRAVLRTMTAVNRSVTGGSRSLRKHEPVLMLRYMVGHKCAHAQHGSLCLSLSLSLWKDRLVSLVDEAMSVICDNTTCGASFSATPLSGGCEESSQLTVMPGNSLTTS